MRIGDREIGPGEPTFFIADIGANHDGRLERAIGLVRLAAAAGADAVKFQHFRAPHIVSDRGFKDLGSQLSHQSKWAKSVFEVYEEASLPWAWTEELAQHSKSLGVEFLTSPYDLDAIDFVNPFIPAFKVGSGDITWLEAIRRMAEKGKPVLLATGASTLAEVDAAVAVLEAEGAPYAILQCNTNYTGARENLSFTNLRVLNTFGLRYPGAILGLSDHTPGAVAVLGAVALGARIIEKHFTDDVRRSGPDHAFAMTPETWAEMVSQSRDLERALGQADKAVAQNEAETVVIQRRSVRFARDLPAGTRVSRDDLVVLRPAPHGSIGPDRVGEVIGKRLRSNVGRHELVTLEALDQAPDL